MAAESENAHSNPHAHAHSNGLTYYEATAGEGPAFPRLEGTHEADVAIVGGGFTGLSAAIMLAERGYRVALIEARRIGWGGSGRNGGQLIAGMSGEAAFRRQLGAEAARMIRSIAYRGHEIIEDWIARFGIDCELRRGWMLAAAKPRHLAMLREECEAHAAGGGAGEVRLIEKSEMAAWLGTRAYHGGLLSFRSGHLHPLKLCHGEARAAQSLGVAIFEQSPVVALDYARNGAARPGRPARPGRSAESPRVRTDRGEVRAGAIVLAGGAYHRLEERRLQGLTIPTGSYIIATEPLDEALAQKLNPHGLAVADSNIVLDYFRLTADRRMLYGGRCNYSGREPRDIAASIRPRMVRVFPELAGVPVAYAWGGRIGINITRVPAFGRLAPQVYYVQGYSGHGVNFSHIAGEIIAEAVAGTSERFDLFARVRHIRLPVGRWLANQLLALGMAYYRLRDLL